MSCLQETPDTDMGYAYTIFDSNLPLVREEDMSQYDRGWCE